MDIENIGTIGTSVISGTLVGILIGYAVKKVLKIGLIILILPWGSSLSTVSRTTQYKLGKN